MVQPETCIKVECISGLIIGNDIFDISKHRAIGVYQCFVNEHIVEEFFSIITSVFDISYMTKKKLFILNKSNARCGCSCFCDGYFFLMNKYMLKWPFANKVVFTVPLIQ